MRYRLFGQTGLRVSELCLGTMTFGEEVTWGASKDESRRIFDAFVAAGGNFIDTANNYTRGTSEKYVGDFIAGERARFVVGTKYTMAVPTGDPNVAGNHRKNLVQTLENSLRSLRTDYLDVLWVHAYDGVTPVAEMMRALDDVVRAGKVLYVGISNAPAWVVARANTLAELRGWTPFAGLQVQYSLVERTAERELLPMARALDLAVTAWAPLGSGLLSGKYNAAPTPSAGPRRLDQSPATPLTDRNLTIAAAVGEVARELGCSPAQVALAWARAKGTLPIVGARTLAQLDDNLASLGVALDGEQLRRLDDVSAVAPGYPHDFLGRSNVRNSVFGGMYDALDLRR